MDFVKRLILAALSFSLFSLCGCTGIGPRTVVHDRFDYTAAIGDSWKEQMLINTVKLLSGDTPVSLDKEINIAHRLKKAFPGIKLIIVSVHDGGTAVGECLVAGASGFVLKRTAVNDLVPAIETVMRGELYISSSVVQTADNIRNDTGS